MNKVIIRGILTKDVESKKLSSGTCMARFNVAVRRDFKNAEGEYDSDFINCIAYNKTGELITKYFHKGSGIFLLGHIQTGSYEKDDGTKVYTTDLIVETVEFDRTNSSKEEKTEKEEKPKQKMSDDPFADFGKQVTLDDNDLPF